MRVVPVLVRPAAPDSRAAWVPDAPARRVLDHPGGPLRVLGGPGTGKTTLIAHAVADRVLRRGADPEQLLVLTSSRRAAVDLRERIVQRLAAHGVTPTVREPLVRTVHSYAFALLRLQASREELRPPRLLSGPEQDVVVRELLAGELEAGGRGWPARLRPALGLPAFAAELRDLLLRAAERGLGPEDLIALGRAGERPEWVAAGRFFRSYEQVMLLRGSVGTAAPQASAPALDAAELVSTALLVLDIDAEALRRERHRVRHLIVDDAQHLDPQQARLVTQLGAGAEELLMLGDPDQTVFSFRGADPGLLTTGGTAVVRLATDYRMASQVRAAVSRLAARLPGARPDTPGPRPDTPGARPDAPGGGGEVCVQVFRSAAAEASWVADRFRRAHLLDGVAWSEMAVVVRSTARTLPVLRRALLAAGVPVAVPREELPVARHGAVLPLLGLLRCAVDPQSLDEETAAALLASPLGGADPLALRRLRRELRRLELAAGGERSSAALLVDVLRPGPDHEPDPLVAIEDRTAAPARRLAGLLATAARTARDGAGAEEVLWRIWQASGLAQRWAAVAVRGGPAGAQADRDLDAVVALFDAAARYADRLPGADGGPAGVLGFCDYVASQQIAGDSLAPRSPQGEAVTVLTAHAAAGREWDVVAVPGVQEGSWPDLRLRGSLLGVEHLVDITAGVESATVSRTAPLLAEERRLLLVAASRARYRLLVSAVQGEDEQPSRFLDELAGVDTSTRERAVAERGRGLSLPEVVAELRRVCCDPAQDAPRRQRAAAGLARLAEAGVPGAHPDSWYGLIRPSTDVALRGEGEPATVSPSVVELVSSCPLRWMLTRHGGEDVRALPAVTGSLVHGLVQAAAAGATDQQLEDALADAWAGVDAGAPWYSRTEQARVRKMVEVFRQWWRDSRGELTEVACEHDVEVELLPATEASAGVALRGRVDRLERDRDGRPVIVDVKSSKTPVSKEAAQEHAQLATYQLAAAHGAFAGQGLAAESGGARIVQVSARTAGSVERTQPPLDGPAVAHWLDVVREVALRTAGPGFDAIENGDCQRCPSRIACPLHDSGRQVTG
ncbi:MAG: ATP-dependent helicase [Pseudonocardiaceae bacterium]